MSLRIKYNNLMISSSQRLLSVPASPIRKLVPFAQIAKKQGVKIFHLNIGDPDIKTPQVFIDVLNKWQKNPISYGQSQGEPAFLEALKTYYQQLGYSFIQAKNIQVTSGGSEAISMVLFSICNPNDEVIVFEPYYANYNSYAIINGVKLRAITTHSDSGFHLPSASEIEKHITKKTKAILICNPNNPTGTVYTKDEVNSLVKIAQKYGLFLIADEVYRDFVYDNQKHLSLLDYMKQLPKQVIVIDSLSKRYSLCGARLGMIVSLNQDITDGVLRIAQGRLSAGLIDQIMACQINNIPKNFLSDVKQEYELRRNLLYQGLKKIPGVSLEKPEGAFYCIVNLPIDNADDFCQWLLTDFRFNKQTVMLAPAAGFYQNPILGKKQVRIAYVLNRNDLKQSLQILAKALIKYR